MSASAAITDSLRVRRYSHETGEKSVAGEAV